MKKLIGTKDFYKRVIAIAIPIMLHQGISSFVNLLDNIMIGNYSNQAMAGVSVTNQIFFVIEIVTIGSLAMAGVYLSQYFGAKNQDGMRYSFRFKFWLGLGISIITLLVLGLFGNNLVNSFLTNPTTPEEKIAIENYASDYLKIILLTIIPFVIVQIYSSSLREVGETIIPMIAGGISVGVNAVFNLWFIFGGLGIPALGVKGAAIATLLARITEMTFLIIFTHKHKSKFTFVDDAFKSCYVPKYLVKNILVKGAPLILNEFLWSFGTTFLLNVYSRRGTEVLKAFSISNTTTNLFYIVFGALATAISILVGQSLGAGKLEEAVDNDRKLIAFTVFVCLIFGIILAIIAPFVPYIYYDSSEEVRHMATCFMWVVAGGMTIFSFNSACFYTLRAGGVTIVTFLFDCLFIWSISIPTAVLLVKYTELNIINIYLIIQSTEIIKSIIGFFLIKSKVWVKNLAATDDGSTKIKI